MLGKYLNGYSVSGIPIIDGAVIFDLVDTRGLPLDVINDLLEENGMGFDVVGFIRKAKSSSNYANPERLRILLISAMKRNNPELVLRIELCILGMYDGENVEVL